jgi:hypothetical protein
MDGTGESWFAVSLPRQPASAAFPRIANRGGIDAPGEVRPKRLE